MTTKTDKPAEPKADAPAPETPSLSDLQAQLSESQSLNALLTKKITEGAKAVRSEQYKQALEILSV